MTREIKFRAWHKGVKEMANVDTIHSNGWAHLSPITKISSDSKMFKIDEIELMQYIGLKDKNGKEIYEGDIVKAGVNALVIFTDGAFILEANGMPKGALVADVNNSYPVEIIGNFYQNSELLK